MKPTAQIMSLAAGLILMGIEPAAAANWMLRVQTMGRVCHVQLETASPIGVDFKGPFSSRKAACQEAAAQYDGSLSDQTKCWAYGGGTVSGCKKDGITLPPRKATKRGTQAK